MKYKFRGYQKELRKWVYGNIIESPNGGCWIFDYKDGFEDRIEVVPESVGKFTGEYDKTGTEIYEGDLLEYYLPTSNTNERHFVKQFPTGAYKLNCDLTDETFKVPVSGVCNYSLVVDTLYECSNRIGFV